MSGNFTNFRNIQQECPRCGEENDKCGIFEETGFVMCRTDMATNEEPNIDHAGWEYWPYQINARCTFTDAYEALRSALILSAEDKVALINRGLNGQAIERNQYRTIPYRSGKEGLNVIVEMLDQRYDLVDVPGFFLKDGKREINAKYKQTLIPVRNFSGQIVQFVLRNNDNKEDKKSSKYIMFSSGKKEDGASVKQQIHFPLGREKCGNEVRITEGILKADVATHLGDIYTIGLHGVNSNGVLDAVNALGVSSVRLCFDADWKTNKNVRRGLKKIYEIIKKYGHDVFIEEWNESDGKGIDDVLLNGGRISLMNEESAREIIGDIQNIEFDPRHWGYVIKRGEFIDLKSWTDNKGSMIINDDGDEQEISELGDGIYYTEKQFSDMFCELDDDFAKQAKIICKKFDRIVFAPEKKLELKDRQSKSLLNLWTGKAFTPNIESKADKEKFFEILNYVFSNDEQQIDLLLDYMAAILQNRGKKLNFGIILKGEQQGTGKTWITSLMSLLIGKKYCTKVTNSNIQSDFNDWQVGKELFIVDEMMSAGRMDIMNKMKGYIEEQRQNINTKNKSMYSYLSIGNWFMSTNYSDGAIIEFDDRRNLVLDVDLVGRKKEQQKVWWDETWQWSGGGKENHKINYKNLAWLYAWLYEREIKINPFGKAPVTDAKTNMMKNTMGEVASVIFDLIEEQVRPFDIDLVCISHLLENKDFMARFRKKPNGNSIGKALNFFGAVQWGSEKNENGEWKNDKKRKININGAMRYVWIIRRKEIYLNMKPMRLSEMYSKRAFIDSESDSGIEKERPF